MSNFRRKSDGRGPVRWPFSVIAVTALILGLSVLAGSFAGEWVIVERFHLGFELFPTSPTPPDQTSEESSPFDERPEYDLSMLGWILFAVFLTLLFLAAWWLFNRGRRLRPTFPDHVVSDWGVDATEPDLPTLRQGAEDARRLIRGTADPSDAVIAAWLALEDASARSGVARKPAQTPTEFTVTVLSSNNADTGATSGLLGLYHLARFSSHPIGREEIEAALTHLERLAVSWDAVQVGPSIRATGL